MTAAERAIARSVVEGMTRAEEGWAPIPQDRRARLLEELKAR
jgi:hypothetical protein